MLKGNWGLAVKLLTHVLQLVTGGLGFKPRCLWILGYFVLLCLSFPHCPIALPGVPSRHVTLSFGTSPSLSFFTKPAQITLVLSDISFFFFFYLLTTNLALGNYPNTYFALLSFFFPCVSWFFYWLVKSEVWTPVSCFFPSAIMLSIVPKARFRPKMVLS